MLERYIKLTNNISLCFSETHRDLMLSGDELILLTYLINLLKPFKLIAKVYIM